MEDILSPKAETAVTVCCKIDGQDETSARLLSEELNELVDTMGLTVLDSLIVPLKKANPKYLIGAGKAQEIAELLEELEPDCLIFDGDISPSQQRNWEELTNICVIDRQEVILDIFTDRARTREATLQVALARMEYSLPRLTRAWTHLSRQRGGTRGTRGEGETQLEVDRRIVLRKIDRIKRELKHVSRERDTQRKKRQSKPVPTGSIVGYTNAGKSSLLNALTDSGVFVEDKLFATLDSTTRKMRLPGGFDVLLSDTVGFIRNLPHGLIEAFKSTLEEAAYADFVIHVVDISNPEFHEHISTTKSVLQELEAIEKPQLLVFNKIDAVPDYSIYQKDFPNAVFISVKNGKGFDNLVSRIQELTFMDAEILNLKMPVYRGELMALLHREGRILSESHQKEMVHIKTAIPRRLIHKFKEYVVSSVIVGD